MFRVWQQNRKSCVRWKQSYNELTSNYQVLSKFSGYSIINEYKSSTCTLLKAKNITKAFKKTNYIN